MVPSAAMWSPLGHHHRVTRLMVTTVSVSVLNSVLTCYHLMSMVSDLYNSGLPVEAMYKNYHFIISLASSSKGSAYCKIQCNIIINSMKTRELGRKIEYLSP